MSIDISGIDNDISGQKVIIEIKNTHPLIKLANKLPWQEMLGIILPDLQNTEKNKWWLGRKLKIRIHLGVYLLQQMYNLTDRRSEYALSDNAAFQLFCGKGIMDNWHAPDHTKIEEFRSRLTPETQRQLANIITKHAARLNYACPTELDIDSTVQEANISPYSPVNLLLKLAIMAKKIANAIEAIKPDLAGRYKIKIGWIKSLVLGYFSAKRMVHSKDEERNRRNEEKVEYLIRRIWAFVFEAVMPVIKDSYHLLKIISLGKYWGLKRAVETLTWQGAQYLDDMQAFLFQGEDKPKKFSLHAREVGCFNKNKIGKKIQFGRHFQIARIKNNFAYVGKCIDVRMADPQSVEHMVAEHVDLFCDGQDKKPSAEVTETVSTTNIKSIAFDRGYYSKDNQEFLEANGIEEIYLPYRKRDDSRTTDLDKDTGVKLHCRRSGIEPIIGHIKHGGQLRRSRMKSDNTTLAAGYSAVLGFNLRQLKRVAIGKIRQIFEPEAKMVA